MKQLLKRLVVEEKGQGITEYALILGLVVLAIWVAVSTTDIGNQIVNLFNRVGNQVGLCESGNCGGPSGGD